MQFGASNWNIKKPLHTRKVKRPYGLHCCKPHETECCALRDIQSVKRRFGYCSVFAIVKHLFPIISGLHQNNFNLQNTLKAIPMKKPTKYIMAECIIVIVRSRISLIVLCKHPKNDTSPEIMPLTHSNCLLNRNVSSGHLALFVSASFPFGNTSVSMPVIVLSSL